MSAGVSSQQDHPSEAPLLDEQGGGVGNYIGTRAGTQGGKLPSRETSTLRVGTLGSPTMLVPLKLNLN